jgi:uncharacterized protein (DUF885 family)
VTNTEVLTLAEEYFNVLLDASPIVATLFGIEGRDALVPDFSEGASDEFGNRMHALLERAHAVSTEDLSRSDRVTRSLLIHEATTHVVAARHRAREYSVDALIGPLGMLTTHVPRVAIRPGGSADYLERCSRLAVMLDQSSDRIRSGVRRGCTPASRTLHNAIQDCDLALATEPSGDPLTQPLKSAGTTDDHDRLLEIIREGLRPALARYRETLTHAVRSGARDDDLCGIVHMPQGEERYAAHVAHHTTTTQSAAEIHELGLSLCSEIRDQLMTVGHEALGTRTFEETATRLLNDTSLRFTSGMQMVAEARASLERAEAELPAWFGLRHQSSCEVVATERTTGVEALVAHYQPPAAAGQRGRYWLNCADPTTRPRHEYEALAFHEGVPGHHLQLMIARDLDVPTFRRHAYVAAYSEGWALYAEHLSDEMGLYTTPLARLGMLTFDAFRAARLVVDTGMHALGWSRDRAIAFMTDHTALPRETIEVEIDRYICWPGQALSYMVGRRELESLRATAKASLGSLFDVRQFHDVVLGQGGLPLSELRHIVNDWVASAGALVPSG